jgi:hypothetical protein
VLKTLFCKIAPHQVDKHRVWHDGLNFRTRCARCGCSLLRDTDGWREFDSALDLQLPRSPHPDFDKPGSDSADTTPL